MSKNVSFKFIDLFAGIGGFHLAMTDVGGKCVFASELDKYARQTYKANFEASSPHLFANDEILFNKDITELDEKCVPDFDLLCAGFPCQPFSQAGYRKGFEDVRGNLFYDIVRIIRNKINENNSPKVILLENIKHFRNHDQGRTLETVRSIFENDLGYHFKIEILNSRDFGLPQNRHRAFMIAWLPELGDFFRFPEISETPETRVKDILEDKVDEKYTISDLLWTSHIARKKRNKQKGNGFGYSLVFHDDEYTRTLPARYYKDGKEILIAQNEKNPRKLTPREAANLQGFPKNFIIPVSDTQAYKQFGNSISVPVVQAIGIEIIKQLLNSK